MLLSKHRWNVTVNECGIGRHVERIWGFGGKAGIKRDNYEDQDIREWIVLRWISARMVQHGLAWSGSK
jgi:hypothetical protein